MILWGITDHQKKVVEAVIEHGGYADAAKVLDISDAAVKAVFYKLRVKDDDAQRYHRQIAQWQRALGPKKRYLT
jgi:hypothetical protein